MDLEELIARESIRDLVARYNSNGDSGRLDPMMDLFADDAVMAVDGREHQGKAGVRAFFEGAVTAFADTPGPVVVRHSVTTHVIDLTGPDSATGRAYYTVFLADGPDHWGRYIDTYARIDGQWRFAKRKVTVDGRTKGGWAETHPSV